MSKFFWRRDFRRTAREALVEKQTVRQRFELEGKSARLLLVCYAPVPLRGAFHSGSTRLVHFELGLDDGSGDVYPRASGDIRIKRNGFVHFDDWVNLVEPVFSAWSEDTRAA